MVGGVLGGGSGSAGADTAVPEPIKIPAFSLSVATHALLLKQCNRLSLNPDKSETVTSPMMEAYLAPLVVQPKFWKESLRRGHSA